jgi:hypothetical protein
MFSGKARRAIDEGRVNAESRFAWAFLEYQGNIEFSMAQNITLRSGRVKRVGAMVVSFPSVGAERSARVLRDTLMSSFGLLRGNRLTDDQ